MNFEFNEQLVPQSLIEIQEVGAAAIEAYTDDGFIYYMVIKTILGASLVATFGPLVPDVPVLPNDFKVSINKYKYNSEKLAKSISYFLNDKKKAITDAKEIAIEDALASFPDIQSYLSNLNGETI